jgi:hypothetical protein
MLDEFDAGGDMICQNCESAAASGAGGNANVPCQRCGMYLPSHELRMWNSRQYCSYCIMDIQDEEKRGKAARGSAGEEGGKARGICERCGREADTLYSVQGRKMCSSCYSVGSGAGGAGAPSLFGLLVEKVALALGVRQKPKVIPALPPGKIGVRAPSEKEDNERRRKSTERFDLKERRMMEEEEGQLGTVEPLSEGRKSEKKPSPEARKKFFSKLAGERKD